MLCLFPYSGRNKKMKPFSQGLTKENPVALKESLLAVQIRCLKSYIGPYQVRLFNSETDETEIFCLSNKKIKNIKVEFEETEP